MKFSQESRKNYGFSDASIKDDNNNEKKPRKK